ncbi:hypothetical protein Fmac_024805 [Flemingia macrophylla]|uniref:G-patch domain-containing protein n=1 Tax=Flemingia macrophylla TaxID=520843 RepID=A0ABD1LQF0_9FABA
MMQEDLTLTRSEAQKWSKVSQQRTISLSEFHEKERRGLAQIGRICEERDRAIDKVNELQALISFYKQKAKEAQANCDNMSNAVHQQAEAMVHHVGEAEDEWNRHIDPLLASTNKNISNIAGIGGMTRSGRIYTPKDIQDKAPKEKEKIEEKEEESKEETDELLKFIKQSEYSIIDQLNRTPTKITLLSLIISSEPQRKALLKVLNEAYVPHGISQDKFEGICKEYLIANVIVENGSSLNVMPKRTPEQVAIKGIHMGPIVRAFDGSKREAVGEINLRIQIRPIIFNVEFQVMDITPAYSCLLGRPWIHDAKAVPSTLHQKVKFVVGDKLVTVQVEDDMLISKPSTLPYVDAAEEAIETSFQALEIASVKNFPHNMKKVAHILIKNGYHPGQGVGKDSQGINGLPIIKDNPLKQSLGYDPTRDRTSTNKGKPLYQSLDQIFRKGGLQTSRMAVVIKCSFLSFDLYEPNDC